MWPRVGYNRPNSIFTVVDFPDPFGPSRPKTSPRRTSKSTLSTALAFGRPQKSLKIFVSPRTDTIASLVFPRAGAGETSGRISETALIRSPIAAEARVWLPAAWQQAVLGEWPDAGPIPHPGGRGGRC